MRTASVLPNCLFWGSHGDSDDQVGAYACCHKYASDDHVGARACCDKYEASGAHCADCHERWPTRQRLGAQVSMVPEQSESYVQMPTTTSQRAVGEAVYLQGSSTEQEKGVQC